jgi:hypothetical protein
VHLAAQRQDGLKITAVGGLARALDRLLHVGEPVGGILDELRAEAFKDNVGRFSVHRSYVSILIDIFYNSR